MGCKIKSIPAMLILGFINGRDIKLTEISDEEMEFEIESRIVDDIFPTITVFNFKENCYTEFQFGQCKVLDYMEKTFSHSYRVELNHPNPRQKEELLERLGEIEDVVYIIKDKEGMSNKIGFLEGHQPYYPFDKDKDFYKSYREQMNEWYSYEISSETYNEFFKLISDIELAFSINHFVLFEKFSGVDFKTTIKDVLSQNQLINHPILSKPFLRVYIGNEFCPNIFPETDKLLKMLEQAYLEGFHITIAFSFLREDLIESRIILLKRLVEWCDINNTSLEVIVNDWGMLELMTQTGSRLEPILGRLLNKRKKDPKYKWKWGIKNYTKDMEKNFLNGNDSLISFLSSRGVNRFEFESHMFKNCIPKGKHSLHFPYYQTNTSQYCTLYADCTGYSRTKQKLVTNCPRYCTEFSSLFPKHLPIIGKGNSIFGFDKAIFVEPSKLNHQIVQGIDRLVYSTW